ncbi:hypothetical protein GH721_08945 [Kriegella sp. EG-1]|nr:hypothetical protein [Flavobacteriaceae bacterium EG-1]
MIPKPGEQFEAKPDGPLIRQNKGIVGNSQWIITCTQGTNISLAGYAHNYGGWSKLTVSKVFFGGNFVKSKDQTIQSRLYIKTNHFFPEVDEKNRILPV